MALTFKRVAEHLYRASNDKYYIIVKRHRRVTRRSLKTSDRLTAEQRLKVELHRAGQLTGPVRHIQFGALANEWQELDVNARGLKPGSLKDRLQNLRALYKAWPALERSFARSITEGDCERWAATRRRQCSAQRFNNELGTLRQIVRFAIRRGVVTADPTTHVTRSRIIPARIEIPTKEQFAAIIGHLRAKSADAKSAADFLELLAYSGMRLEEAAWLRWNEIDFDRGLFHVTGGIDVGGPGTKNGKRRIVPLFPALRELLGRIPQTGKRRVWRVCRVWSCKKSLEQACAAVGAPRLTHHDMRHFFVSNAIDHGVDFRTIADWVGHSDGGLLVAKTYGHLRQEHSTNMAAKMDFSAQQVSKNGLHPVKHAPSKHSAKPSQ